MYIVLQPSYSERGDNSLKYVHKLADENALRTWLRSYAGSLAQLQIFEATAIDLGFVFNSKGETNATI